jgi:hypothetical protein
LLADPTAVALSPPAWALKPKAVAWPPLALLEAPNAVAVKPIALAVLPTAVACVPELTALSPIVVVLPPTIKSGSQLAVRRLPLAPEKHCAAAGPAPKSAAPASAVVASSRRGTRGLRGRAARLA